MRIVMMLKLILIPVLYCAGCVTVSISDEVLLRETVPFEYEIKAPVQKVWAGIHKALGEEWVPLAVVKDHWLASFKRGETTELCLAAMPEPPLPYFVQILNVLTLNIQKDTPSEAAKLHRKKDEYDAYLNILLRPSRDITFLRIHYVENRARYPFHGTSKLEMPIAMKDKIYKTILSAL